MSVTIHWRVASDQGKHFKSGTSDCLAALEKAFDSELNEKHVPTLRAMAIATKNEFYNEVADTIERVGAIEVWGVW